MVRHWRVRCSSRDPQTSPLQLPWYGRVGQCMGVCMSVGRSGVPAFYGWIYAYTCASSSAHARVRVHTRTRKSLIHRSNWTGGNQALAEVVARRLRLDHGMLCVLAMNLAQVRGKLWRGRRRTNRGRRRTTTNDEQHIETTCVFVHVCFSIQRLVVCVCNLDCRTEQ